MVQATKPAWKGDLESAARRHLDAESSGHDSAHAFRVRNIAIRIAASIGADVEVVEAAALLHDIAHGTGRADHARRGSTLARGVLSECRFPADKIKAVVNCIEHHHWEPRRAGDPRQPTLDYQAFADADRLDALGAIGIARTFAFGGANGRVIWNPEPETVKKGLYGVSSIHHFYDKLLQLPNDMYTEPGKRLASRRVRLMEEFLDAFYLEWEDRDFELVNGNKPDLPSSDVLSKRAIELRNRVRRIPPTILQANPIN
jgi:uncharacterized protein